MTDEQSAKASDANWLRIIFFALCCYLIVSFLYRMLLTAHQYPSRTEQVMTMVLDALCVVGLVGTRANGPRVLFWLAVAAGIAMFAIRLTGDASWWTGHLSYSLPPR